MCDNEDMLWLENFHKRIIEGGDPLRQYSYAEKAYMERSTRTSNRKVTSGKLVKEGKAINNYSNNSLIRFRAMHSFSDMHF